MLNDNIALLFPFIRRPIINTTDDTNHRRRLNTSRPTTFRLLPSSRTSVEWPIHHIISHRLAFNFVFGDELTNKFDCSDSSRKFPVLSADRSNQHHNRSRHRTWIPSCFTLVRLSRLFIQLLEWRRPSPVLMFVNNRTVVRFISRLPNNCTVQVMMTRADSMKLVDSARYRLRLAKNPPISVLRFVHISSIISVNYLCEFTFVNLFCNPDVSLK